MPVGEFVDCLHEHRKAEHMHAFGVSTLQVALAYVLCQPRINIFALIGPLPPNKIDISVRALEVALSSAELAWLDLEADTPPL